MEETIRRSPPTPFFLNFCATLTDILLASSTGALKCQNEDGKISKSVHSNCCLRIMVGHIHLFDGFAPRMLPLLYFGNVRFDVDNSQVS